ncbi:nucleobase:cation symporter-2 family protein [Salinisphaera sp. T31B1]|uniref:nucleobase:cation symporter-2 family protein n=1 Tax=Salinisphaera sp. T31B1 TaxID=727963 RepID=UPI0033417354
MQDNQTMTTDTHVCAADRKLPIGQLLPMGVQHVLVMYAGTIAVALIVGGALDLPREDISYLIMADLLCCGIGTLIQSLGIWIFGIRMPIVMGSSFVTVGPMVAMATSGHVGIAGIFGATVVSGVFGIALVPFFTRLLKFFPPLVTGTVIASIGISLIPVGINWAAGGVGASDFGAPVNVGLAVFVLACILTINRIGRGIWVNISVLIGLLIGYLVALPLGVVSLDGLASQPVVGVVTPLHFGMLEFPISGIIAMCIIMVVTLVESTGMCLALGEMVGKPVDRRLLNRGLYGDGIATAIAGFLNGFPHTSFSQNVGLVGMTGVTSRYVTVVSGFVLIVLSLFPQAAFVVASIPKPVLGGAGLVMFGMVASAGINIMNKADMSQRTNQLVFAVSIGFGMIPLAAPDFFAIFPDWTAPIVHSGILLTAVAAVITNLLLNGGDAVADESDTEEELESAARRQSRAAGPAKS